MKGLLIKDIRLMANQKQFFLALGGMCVLFLAIYDDPTFTISYMMIMFSIFTVSTISYDGFDNGNAYLFTLPISRKGYVLEKYVFGILTILSSMIIAVLLSLATTVIKHFSFAPDEWLAVTLVSTLFVTTVLAVAIPVQFKFGAERSRMVMVAVMLVIFLFIYLLAKYSSGMGVDIDTLIGNVMKLAKISIVLVVLAACAAIYAISCAVSMKIMEGKEF